MTNPRICRSVRKTEQSTEVHGSGKGNGGGNRRGNRGYIRSNQQGQHFHTSQETTPEWRRPRGYTASGSGKHSSAPTRSKFPGASHAGAQHSSTERINPAQRKGKKGQRVRGIGIGRATGVSRVPDAKLSTSAPMVRGQLKELVGQMETLLHEKRTMLGQAEAGNALPLAEGNLDVWETIQGRFRKLTMSITASSNSDVNALAIPVYERAA